MQLFGCFNNTNLRLSPSRIRLTVFPKYKYSGNKRYLPDEFIWNNADKKRKYAYFLGVLENKNGKYAQFSSDLACFHTVFRFPWIHPDTIYRGEVHNWLVRFTQIWLIPIYGNILYKLEVSANGLVHLHVISTRMISHNTSNFSFTTEHDNLAKLLTYLSKPVDARFNPKYPLRIQSLHALILKRLAPYRCVVGIRSVATTTRYRDALANKIEGARYWFLDLSRAFKL